MSDIVLSKGIRSNLLSLIDTAGLRDQTQTRLSTGKRVNSALDNPGNYFSAAQLNGRAADITNLLDGIGNAVQTLQAADNGISAIIKVVTNMQAIARQAQGSASTLARLSGLTPKDTTGTPTALKSNTNLVTDLGFAAGDTLTINTGTNRTTTLTIATGTTVQDLVNAINDNSSIIGAGVGTGVAIGTDSGADAKASLTPDGRLLIEATGTQPIAITATGASATVMRNLGFDATNSSQPAGKINPTRTDIAIQFGELRRQIDQLARDAGYNGINLLDGDTLQAMFNEKQTSSLTITGARLSTDKDLAIKPAANNLQTDKDINDALEDLTFAMNKLRAQSSAFGSNLALVQIRQKFTQELANTLKVGADNLTLADMNEEGANMLALQTRQQLSVQALSLANQADQGVLRLFG
ncbi:flagellin N-terminal helical domain-containing protein [Phreatobacter sp. AB_2022a]|uniref:flagellin N-terminal helical domain-containing protein n=1 Tax=Phreatobacter sp. AB_2022a TaxID=3003134 RepID=UPI002286FA20|nr:flagellin [Phreatobacter sp. AB_2022a]MCZ0735562.1 flagellin [Phreatobacter sp. AB_2022a]